jgi:uncharacterized protein (DUF2342 family)
VCLAVCRVPSSFYFTGGTSYLCATIQGSALSSNTSKRFISDIHLDQLRHDFVLTYINDDHVCSRFIYPSIVSVLIASLFYPSGFGRYLATTLSTKQQVGALFANFTWLSDDLSVEQAERLSHWDVANTNLFVGLGIFMSANVWQRIITQKCVQLLMTFN